MRINEGALRKIIRQEIVGQAVRSGTMSLQEGRHILSEGMQNFSQDLMDYLRSRSGAGPFWNADWEVRLAVLRELDRLIQIDPKDRILANAYSELLDELRSTAKASSQMRTMGLAAKKALGI